MEHQTFYFSHYFSHFFSLYLLVSLSFLFLYPWVWIAIPPIRSTCKVLLGSTEACLLPRSWLKSSRQAGSNELQTPGEESEQQLIIILPGKKKEEEKKKHKQFSNWFSTNLSLYESFLWYLSGSPIQKPLLYNFAVYLLLGGLTEMYILNYIKRTVALSFKYLPMAVLWS